MIEWQLQCHKYNKGIHTIFGTDDSSFYARPTNAQIGTVSHDSIVQEDNLEYFIAKDGIYAFDGKDTARISDLIYPDIQAIINNLSNIVSDTWDTQAQFNGKKQDIAGATTTATGDLVVFSSQTVNAFGELSSDFVFTLTNGSTSTEYMTISTSIINPTNLYTGFLQSGEWFWEFGGVGVPERKAQVTFRNDVTSATFTRAIVNGDSGHPDNGSQGRRFFNLSSTFQVSVADITSGRVRAKIEVDTVTYTYGATQEIRISTASKWHLILGNTTGSYISEITTITAANITNWDTFRSNFNTNGGNVRFYMRSATSVVIVSSEAWSPISDGSVIPFPTHRNYVQWFATINALNYDPNQDISPVISWVNLNHNESGSADSRPVGTNWKNRFHLFVTTRVSGDTSVGYVKSRITNEIPNAWMIDNGINIKSVKKVFDNLYGGSSTAGAIIRLYHGTNDAGNATNAFYETSDNFMGTLFSKKTLVEYFVDAEPQTNANLTIETIIDGVLDSTHVKSITGSTRVLSPIRNLMKKGKYFRWRFSNNQLDKGLSLNTFGVKFQRTNIDD